MLVIGKLVQIQLKNYCNLCNEKKNFFFTKIKHLKQNKNYLNSNYILITT